MRSESAKRSRVASAVVAVVFVVLSTLLAGGVPTARAEAELDHPYAPMESLVGHLEYQLRFRSAFDFLSTEPAHLTSMLVGGGNVEAMEYLGLELSDDEWHELERREGVLARAIDVRRLVTGRLLDTAEESTEPPNGRNATGPLFSGIWQDHLAGGTLYLAVTDSSAIDRSELDALFPRAADDFEVIEQKYSLDQLYQWRDLLASRLIESEVASGVGFSYSRDFGVRLRLELYPESRNADMDELLKGIPTEQVVVEELPQASEFLNPPAQSHTTGAQQSGIQIGVYGSGWNVGACTWGIAGHTSSYTYVVTAGHCTTGFGSVLSGWGLRYVTQNGGSTFQISTQPSAFTYARLYDTSATFDHARISSPYADTNCYHGTILDSHAHCVSPITRRLSLYGHTVGQVICASLGITNDYNCGTVSDADWSGYVSNRWTTNRVQVDPFDADHGDSGSGIVAGPTFHGLLTSGIPGVRIEFEPAYWVKAYIGATSFDINCVRSGSWWGACPIVYS